MADSTEPGRGADAILRARRTRVAVVGGGVAGLVAALEWAKIGAHVTVLEASGRLGGALETAALDGIPVDLVADAFPTRAAALAGVIDELRLRSEVDGAAALPVWISGVPGRAGGLVPLPAQTVLGIPANPWADDVRRVIGWRGAWRAYLDRLRPPLTIGHERSLGRLVRQRMGDRVVDRLVAPVTRGLYGVEPDDVDVEAAAPGLSTALTRTGSLAGAVFDLLPQSEGEGASRATLRGGFGALATALAERLLDLDADLRVDRPVTALARTSHGSWTVRAGAESQDARGPEDAAQAEDAVEADIVVIATGGDAAVALLAGIETQGAEDGAARAARVAVETPPAPARDVVDLVVHADALTAAPRGRAVYPLARAADPAVAPAALSVTLPSAEWPSVAAAAGPHRRVLRVALPADPARSDAATVDAAVTAAAALLGVDVTAIAPIAAARRTVVLAPPASVIGHTDRVDAVRSAVSALPGLSVVGSWLAGGGVAQVVADALAETDRVRSAVLWRRAPDGPERPAQTPLR